MTSGWSRRRSATRARPGYWAVTRYADLEAISSQPAVFCSGKGAVSIQDIPTDLNEFYGSMISMDDPRHAKIRRLVSKTFTPRTLERVLDSVREIVGDVVAAARRKADAGDGAIDVVADIAAPIPLRVICGVGYDPALSRTPDLVTAIGSAAQLAVDNERLWPRSGPTSRSSAPPAPASSPSATPPAHGGNATCTTARSSGLSPSPTSCAWLELRPRTPVTPGRCRSSTRHCRRRAPRPRRCASSRTASTGADVVQVSVQRVGTRLCISADPIASAPSDSVVDRFRALGGRLQVESGGLTAEASCG